MSFYDWKPYVPAAERRKKAKKAAARARKTSANLSPVAPARGAIAKTFWGKAWCDNLERYSDFANRLPRGRTYLRNGSVIDLKISAGEVQAQVVGSRLYKVAVKVIAVPGKQWQSINADCAGSINSLVELLQGRLSTAVMERICTRNTGLFPAPKEIQFSCSCPDWASMCKHVAAVLYGVGVRLDEQPELIFTLRRVDAHDLVTRAGAGLSGSNRAPTAGKVLDDVALGDVFGIEMADVARMKKPAAPRASSTATQAAAKTAQKASTARKTEAIQKTARAQKSLGAKLPASSFAGAHKSTTGKANAGAATTASKGKVATTGPVSGRLAKAKSR